MTSLIPVGNDFCSCPKSGAWLTPDSAKRRLKKHRKNSRRNRIPVRVYQCDEGIFHLTSQELKGEG